MSKDQGGESSGRPSLTAFCGYLRYGILVLLAVQLAPLGILAEANIWTPIGLAGFSVNALAVDPRSESVVYAATEVGILKTTDGGAIWSSANAGIGGNTRALLIDPSSPDTIFAGTESAGVLKSTDAGAHWIQKNSGLTMINVWAIAMHPQNPSVLFAGTWGAGLFRSTDGGESWSPSNEGFTEDRIRCVLFNPIDPQIMFAATWVDGIFKSEDGGAHWHSSSTGIEDLAGGVAVATIALDPKSPATAFAGTDIGGIYKSMDGGGRWSSLAGNRFDLASVWSIVLDPTKPGRLLAGTEHKVFLSQNDGMDWIPYNSGLPGRRIHALAFKAENPQQLLAGTSDGAFQITIGCSITCGSDAPTRVQVGVPARFNGVPTILNCTGSPFFHWDFGDGVSSEDQSTDHAYDTPGTYSWTLTVTLDGISCHQSGAVIVTPDPPCTLNCQSTVPSTIEEHSPVEFACMADTSSTCSESPTFSWDFGDGASSAERNPTHRYSGKGLYRWSLTTSVDGLECIREGTVSVLPSDNLPFSLLGNEACSSGGIIDVPLVLARSDSRICACAGEVSFDDSALTLIMVEPSRELLDLDFHTIWNLRDGGKLKFALFSLALPRAMPNGIVAYLSFMVHPEATGPALLNLLASASTCDGEDIPIGSGSGSVTAERPPITVTVSWEGPGRTECGPPQNMEVTVNLPGEIGSSDRAAAMAGTVPVSPHESASAMAPILVGYDLYRSAGGDLNNFIKVNPVLIPLAYQNFLDEDVPSGSVIYKAQAVYDSCFSDYSPPTQTQIPPCAIGCSAFSDPASGPSPLAVRFAATAFPSAGCTGDLVYRWDFGDGSSSAEKNPEHVYVANGYYTWTLTTSAGGFSSSRSGTAIVGELCTLACFALASPIRGIAPLAVSFSTTAMANGACLHAPDFHWDFGDGTTSTEQNPSHTYTLGDLYTWTLTASADGFSISRRGEIIVDSCVLTSSPKADPESGRAPLEVHFSSKVYSSWVCEGGVSYAWDFGDGATSTEVEPLHTYTSMGFYTWSLTVSTGANSTTQYGTVVVGAGDCIVTLTAAAVPGTGIAPLLVQFASSFTSSNCTPSPTGSWSFGDGATSPEPNPKHSYALPGDYTWSFFVTAGDLTWIKTGTIRVTKPPCPIASCSASATPTSSEMPLSIRFQGNVTAQGNCTDLLYSWTFGDGATADTKEAMHTYTAPGSYDWIFRVTGDQPCSKSGTVLVSCDYPIITGVTKLNSPFRLKVEASGLKGDCAVYLADSTVAWARAALKGSSQILIKGAGSLFPKDGSWVKIRIENPSRCSILFEYNRKLDQWRVI